MIMETAGLKKNTVWQKQSKEIKKQGIIFARTPHHVGMKIKMIEGGYKKNWTGSIKKEVTFRRLYLRNVHITTSLIPLWQIDIGLQEEED
jgi:hypothetical protein